MTDEREGNILWFGFSKLRSQSETAATRRLSDSPAFFQE